MPNFVFLSFSVDGDYLIFSTESSFYVYSVANKAFVLRESSLGGMRIVRNLGDSAALLLVPSGDKPGVLSSPRRPKFWSTQSKAILCDLSLDTSVEAALWNRHHAIFSIEKETLVYDLVKMKVKSVIPRNPNSHALALSQEGDLLALPGMTTGSVDLYSCLELRLVNQIPVHRSAVAHIAFNRQSTLMATASATGTIVRVFNLPSGQLLRSYRISHVPNSLCSIFFCPKSHYLVCHGAQGVVYFCSVSQERPVDTVPPDAGDACDEDQDGDYLKVEIPSMPKEQSVADNLAGLLKSDATRHLLDLGLQGISQFTSASRAWIAGKSSVELHVKDSRLERPVLEAEIGSDVHAVSVHYYRPADLSESGTSTISALSSNTATGRIHDFTEKGGALKLVAACSTGVMRTFEVLIHNENCEANRLALDDEACFIK